MDPFPRRSARTQRFTLGEPRSVTVAADGRRVAFLRSGGGEDPVNRLWVLDVGGPERLVADPADVAAGGLSDAERARRERVREAASGITSYACDPDLHVAATALGSSLVVVDLDAGVARIVPLEGPVFDPRPDPTGRRVAYVAGDELHVVDLSSGAGTVVAPGDGADVSWGSAEFVAAEEMGRTRGYWWSPDGERLAVTRVDVGPVDRWWVADPGDPARHPTELRYPAAGTDNALVTLHVLDLVGGRVDVDLDTGALPYLADVSWTTDGGLVAVAQARDQRRLAVLAVDPDTGATTTLHEERDERWVDLVLGVPGWLADGRLVFAGERDGARRLLVGGEPVTPADLQLRGVVDVGDDHVVLTANRLDEPTGVHVWRWSADGAVPLTIDPGVHSAVAGGGTVVLRSASLDRPGTRTLVNGHELASLAADPDLVPNIQLLRTGARQASTALLLPTGHEPGRPLPVLLDPYGGPGAQRVVAARNPHLASQWLADEGFAVVVVDGRGTPGRGTGWERAVHLDLAEPVLEDQLDALHDLAARTPELDLDRVAIRGWSFGGYLAALAVLRRPDVVHAAVAGAPVTDWRLYDTHYTERYLGDPTVDDGPYRRCSLLEDASRLERPLLLIHGLADDNVVAAHTLRLSTALLAAGRTHSVLALSGVTHMASNEVVAENLLLAQVAFLHAALAPPSMWTS